MVDINSESNPDTNYICEIYDNMETRMISDTNTNAYDRFLNSVTINSWPLYERIILDKVLLFTKTSSGYKGCDVWKDNGNLFEPLGEGNVCTVVSEWFLNVFCFSDLDQIFNEVASEIATEMIRQSYPVHTRIVRVEIQTMKPKNANSRIISECTHLFRILCIVSYNKKNLLQYETLQSNSIANLTDDEFHNDELPCIYAVDEEDEIEPITGSSSSNSRSKISHNSETENNNFENNDFGRVSPSSRKRSRTEHFLHSTNPKRRKEEQKQRVELDLSMMILD